jgi:hypothetical protein
MARRRLNDQLNALKARCSDLRQELTALQSSNRQLQLRQALTVCWGDTLSTLLKLAPQHQSCVQLEGQACLLERLLKQEAQLMQQLSSGDALTGTQPSLQALLQPGLETISPCSDPMAYLHRTLLHLPQQDALQMTAEDLAAFMQKAVLSVSIKTHKCCGLPSWERSHILTEIADIWDR